MYYILLIIRTFRANYFYFQDNSFKKKFQTVTQMNKKNNKIITVLRKYSKKIELFFE